MESKPEMTIEEKSEILQKIRADIATKGPPEMPLTDEEFTKRERESRIGSINRLRELGFEVESDTEGRNVKIIDVPPDFKLKTKRQKEILKQIRLKVEEGRADVDPEAIMEGLNPRAPRSEGATIGEGNAIRREWRKSYPPKWRPTKGRTQARWSSAKAASELLHKSP